MEFYFSAFSIPLLANALLLVYISLYFVWLRKKLDPTKYFGLFLFFTSITFFSFFIFLSTVSSFVATISWQFLHLFVFGSYFFVRYAYTFPQNDFAKEQKYILPIFMALSVAALLEYIIHSVFFNKIQFDFLAGFYLFTSEPVPGIIIGIQLGWAFVVMFRKIHLYSEAELTGKFVQWKKSGHQSAGTLKNFIAYAAEFFKKLAFAHTNPVSNSIRNIFSIFLYMAVVVLFVMLAVYEVISWHTTMIVMSIGAEIVLFFLVNFYLNNTKDKITFMIKIIAGFLVSVLVTFSVVSGMISSRAEIIFDEMEIQKINFLQSQDLSESKNMPNFGLYIVKVAPSSGSYEIKNSAAEWITPAYLQEQDKFGLGNQTDKISDQQFADTLTQRGLLKRFYRKDYSNNESRLIVAYLFSKDNEIYEIGYPYQYYRKFISEQLDMLVWYVLLASLLVVTLVPLFYRTNLLRPLDELLNGLRKVNDNNLDVEVPVRYHDEIGYLTGSFNNMVVSIRNAREELKHYTENLEHIVEDRTKELSEAKKETDSILKTVRNGIFILTKENDDYVFGSQYSLAMINIFETNDFSKKSFIALLSPFEGDIPKDDIRKFLKLMFNPAIDEETLRIMNPMEELHLSMPSSGSVKILNFRFVRIVSENKQVHLMGTVIDDTEKIFMALKLAENEKQKKTQMEMVFSLINVEPSLLSDFIVSANNDLVQIDQILSEDGSAQPLNSRLEGIFSSIHSIKGNAALLDLNFLADTAHEYEEVIHSLLKGAVLKNGDFSPVTIGYEKTKNIIVEMEIVLQKIVRFQDQFGTARVDASAVVLSALNKLVFKLANELGKKIRLDSDSFDHNMIPDKHRVFLKDVLIQLVRNSIWHGIEMPEERIALGKNELGIISLSITSSDSFCRITLKDDGRGLQRGKILEKAVKLGIISHEQQSGMSEDEISELIFASGLTTADSVTQMAGRGAGMDVVRNKIAQLGGTIRLEYKAGEFTSFILEIPV